MDWIALQAFCGAVLPPIIELFFKNAHKKVKGVIVAIFAGVTIFLQMAVSGKWDVPVYQILINFVALMYFSIGSFSLFWKKLFPNDAPPDVIVPIKPDMNYGTLTE